MKTKPKSIRFDEEKLEFAKKVLDRETPQGVVDLLLETLWWQHHVGERPALKLPSLTETPQKSNISTKSAYRAMDNPRFLKKNQ